MGRRESSLRRKDKESRERLSSDWERCPNYPPPRGAVPSLFALRHDQSAQCAFPATRTHLDRRRTARLVLLNPLSSPASRWLIGGPAFLAPSTIMERSRNDCRPLSKLALTPPYGFIRVST